MAHNLTPEEVALIAQVKREQATWGVPEVVLNAAMARSLSRRSFLRQYTEKGRRYYFVGRRYREVFPAIRRVCR